MATFSEEFGQHWPQILQLLLAVALSAAIGIERQARHKSAGLRTNTLVGLGSALFMLISKYGFTDVISWSHVVVDPSRIAAQIVSGIGFIGGGIIFKQESDVRGLTTAAAVWLTAAVGTACGAGLPILAALTTALYFITVVAFPLLWAGVAKLRVGKANSETTVQVRYSTGLEPILDEILKSGVTKVDVKRVDEVVLSALHSPVIAVDRQSMRQHPASASPLPPPMMPGYRRIFDTQLVLCGHGSLSRLADSLSRLETVVSVSFDDEAGEI